MTLTQERLRELLHYDPETGIFTWLETRRNRKKGAVAGQINNLGYVKIKVEGKTYAAHRLVFLYMTGAWPKGEVDHRGLNKSDNRWSELRESDRSKQRANTPSKTRLGPKGVFLRESGRYGAQVKCKGKNLYLGTFDKMEDAAAAVAAKLTELHGEFARPT